MLKETISLLVLALALNLMSAIVAGFGFRRTPKFSWPWLAVLAASLTAAAGCLVPGYVAIRTGLYDFDGALVMAIAALGWQVAAWGFLTLSEAVRKPPPR